jgi:two-component system response regulator ChvI
MPGLTGIEVLQKAREVGVKTPMILLTTLTDPIYEESALDNGAVDFVEKSRSFSILLKRVELILSGAPRKTEKNHGGDGILTVGPLELRSESHRALWTDKEVPLTLSEFDIVKLMASRSGTDVSFKDIHHLVHGEGFVVGFGPEGYRANVRTYIKRIRKKFRDIDEQFDAIKNYPGFGYSWRKP